VPETDRPKRPIAGALVSLLLLAQASAILAGCALKFPGRESIPLSEGIVVRQKSFRALLPICGIAEGGERVVLPFPCLAGGAVTNQELLIDGVKRWEWNEKGEGNSRSFWLEPERRSLLITDSLHASPWIILDVRTGAQHTVAFSRDHQLYSYSYPLFFAGWCEDGSIAARASGDTVEDRRLLLFRESFRVSADSGEVVLHVRETIPFADTGLNWTPRVPLPCAVRGAHEP